MKFETHKPLKGKTSERNKSGVTVVVRVNEADN
jgi:hypothetical protein